LLILQQRRSVFSRYGSESEEHTDGSLPSLKAVARCSHQSRKCSASFGNVQQTCIDAVKVQFCIDILVTLTSISPLQKKDGAIAYLLSLLGIRRRINSLGSHDDDGRNRVLSLYPLNVDKH
jgi:hypothetical protein